MDQRRYNCNWIYSSASLLVVMFSIIKYLKYSYTYTFNFIVILILLLLCFPVYISGMEEMQAVVYKSGGAEGLSVDRVPKPTVGEGQILIRIHYFAINRADILQRKGLYPSPKGESSILGLEAAGIIDSIGSNCSKQWRLGLSSWGLACVLISQNEGGKVGEGWR